jgi:hypothetical protein
VTPRSRRGSSGPRPTWGIWTAVFKTPPKRNSPCIRYLLASGLMSHSGPPGPSRKPMPWAKSPARNRWAVPQSMRRRASSRASINDRCAAVSASSPVASRRPRAEHAIKKGENVKFLRRRDTLIACQGPGVGQGFRQVQIIAETGNAWSAEGSDNRAAKNRPP